MQDGNLSWLSIVRLGIVQTALGAIVVLMTSTLNRVMVVELALPAILPGALVTLHHAMQLLRPRMGYGSDLGQRHTPWIVGGMAALALGGVGATLATTWLESHFWLALGLSVLSFAAIGAGVSACGTSLLVLMAKRVAESRRAAAATIVWMMMIAGFAITATVAGKLLDPFSAGRLISVASGVCGLAFLVAVLAVWGVEGDARPVTAATEHKQPTDFRSALAEVWSEPDARRFTLFVFISMLSYSAQDLILEPFAGAIFNFTPGESTRLSGTQHGGVFAGMLLVAVVVSAFKGSPLSSLKAWVIGGCIASSLAMCGLVWAGVHPGAWPLRENVFLLGLANGVFSIAAISSMMALARRGRGAREGTRMGLWGAAQAISFAMGGVTGTILVDVVKRVAGPSGGAYAFVFALEAIGFFVAQRLARATHFAETFDEIGLHATAADTQQP
jgi:BCD family chlorophyll transporter-like MFS transporter